ncbi:YidB family protein [Providencia rustigianii]|uniref:YidB family protein n=1 Tax=Providencia rustigianii TaxID=158850 RepID=UPI00224349A6|nr:YidB family protein [Providencia rustigianii]
MGLFDQMLSLVAGDKMQQFQSVIDWVENQDGLSGVVDKFNQEGLGNIAASWIGEGENLPIDASQLTEVFGNLGIEELAQHVGLDPQQTSDLVAKYLPTLVDGATPDGVLPENIDLASIGMNLLKQKLFG